MRLLVRIATSGAMILLAVVPLDGAATAQAVQCPAITFAAGAPGRDVGGHAGAGRVRLTLHGRNRVVLTAPDAQAGAQFGRAIAIADVTDDGCLDVIIGAPGTDITQAINAGKVYVFAFDPTLGTFVVVQTWVRGLRWCSRAVASG